MPKAKLTSAAKTSREAEIPRLAKSATHAAHKRALKSGAGVVVYRKGELLRVDAQGKSTVLKKMEQRPVVAKGTRLVLARRKAK